jgi:hypothetical protein
MSSPTDYTSGKPYFACRPYWRGREKIAHPKTSFANRFAVLVTIFAAWTGVAIADQTPRLTLPSQLTNGDRAAAQLLAKQITALSPSIRPEEASQLAECTYASAKQLRREYGVIGPPFFNNVLVNTGIRKRGLCFQWAEDLLVALDRLQLTTLEVRWGEAQAGTWHESNCIVVTGKGQPFNTGIILDCWRHSGHLYWRDVSADKEPWVENSAYARFVRNKSAAGNRRFAFQTRGGGKQKRSRDFRGAEN